MNLRDVGPDWWSGLDGLTFYGFDDFIRCIFLESDTAVAVLTAQPADGNGAVLRRRKAYPAYAIRITTR